MATANWYTSRDGEQVGPITSQELKQKAASGEVSADDLVWKEGMAEWVPASKVPGLSFEDAKPAPAPSPLPTEELAEASSAVDRPRRTSFAKRSPLGFLGPFAWPMVLIGLLGVLLTKGCGDLTAISAKKATNNLRIAAAEFEQKYDDQMAEINDELAAIASGKGEKSRLQELTDRRTAVLKRKSEERRDLTKGAWRSMQRDARMVPLKRAQKVWWYRVGFLIGSFVLTLGLLSIVSSGQPTERVFALVLLAIITFSAFGGAVLTFSGSGL
jgi:hypothetical protein